MLKRSVETASNSENRLQGELTEHTEQINVWLEQARNAISANNETDARIALQRKQQEEHIVAGLQLQHQAARQYIGASLNNHACSERSSCRSPAQARRDHRHFMPLQQRHQPKRFQLIQQQSPQMT